jgi:hypothetical protein
LLTVVPCQRPIFTGGALGACAIHGVIITAVIANVAHSIFTGIHPSIR